jgi:replication factor C subunit 1
MKLMNVKVATSGYIEQLSQFTSFLTSRGARIVTWASDIDLLILGTGYESRWKYAAAVTDGIKCVSVHDVMGSVESELWTTKYTPKNLRQVIGHTSQIQELMKWLTNWTTESDNGNSRGAFVSGPPGIGKTTTVHLIIRACGYDIVEFNASDERSAIAIRRWFDEASRSGAVGRRRVVVMDECDGMSRGDRGGIGELARIIKQCVFRIICIANERGSPRMRPLVSACLDIRFARPTKSVIARALMAGVVGKERLQTTAASLETLCERNGNDIRSILNTLQFSKQTDGAGMKDELLRVDAFSAAGKLLGGDRPFAERDALVFVDYGLIPLMVAEGYVATVDRSRDRCSDVMKLKRCARAAEAIGDWDILERRIRSSQQWTTLPYAVSASVRAATICNGAAPFQLFPSWLGKHSKRLKHRRWFSDMGRRIGHRSDIYDTCNLLRQRVFRAGASGIDIVNSLCELGLTRDDMMETLTDTIYKGDEGQIQLDTKTKGAVTREWKKREVNCSEVKKNDDVESDSYYDSDEEPIDIV